MLAKPNPQQNVMDLKGHGGTIENVGMLEPFNLDTPLGVLKEEYQRKGVLWIKGLLDPAFVNKMRADYLEFVNKGSGMLKEGTVPVDGIFSGADWREFVLPGAIRAAAGLPNDGPFVENSNRAHASEFYQNFKDEVGKRLQKLVGDICNFEDPWCLPRSILRCNVPGGETTPVHYDQLFLRGGPPTSITAWVPIGDVELRGGGLIYLEQSHQLGAKLEDEFSAMNATLSEEERASAFNKNMEKGGWLTRDASCFGNKHDRRWLVGQYEAGDVVFHSPFMIHAAATNESDERIRVSTDLRFVDKSKPYDKRWTTIAYQADDTNFSQLDKA